MCVIVFVMCLHYVYYNYNAVVMQVKYACNICGMYMEYVYNVSERCL